MNDHALDPDHLRSLAPLPVKRLEHVRHRPGKVRAVLAKPRRSLGGLARDNRAAKALHRGVVHRDRLRGDHALDFVGRLESDKRIARDLKTTRSAIGILAGDGGQRRSYQVEPRLVASLRWAPW
jgi:hypothetical protein